MEAAEAARLLLEVGALSFNVDEPFTFASGIKSPVYVDCRLLISDVARRKEMVDALAEDIKAADSDVVAATASAGIPWGSWVAAELDKPLVYVRKKGKGHGKGKRIEGVVNGSAAVVEDLVSTGMSSLAAVEALRDAGAKVEDCFCIFAYGMESAVNAFKNAGVQVHTLSDFKTALEAAVGMEYLTSDQAGRALEWLNDPEGWSI